MAKRRKTRRSRARRPGARRSRTCAPCKKRKGSPRFTAVCRAKFKTCMTETLRSGGSFRTAGKKCMTDLHKCAGSRTQKAAVRKYKQMKAA